MSAPARVNYIRHLNSFFQHVRNDDRLKANDISLYVALFQIWNMHGFRSSFPIARQEVMNLSCIGSRSTYMTCMKRLHACGYIVYQKALKKYVSSTIKITLLTERPATPNSIQLSLFKEQKEEDARPNIEPHTRPNTEPYIRPNSRPHTGPNMGHLINKQINNNKKESKGKITRSKKIIVKNEKLKSETPGAPEISEVQEYFRSAAQPDKEAKKFFYHYDAIGWTLSGAQISKWQSAARKWIENITTLKKKKNDGGNITAGRLHTNEDKSYKDAF